ncbi:MAG: tRNA (N6-isopentenyl adenosine(37)-C2)-methylthiotransferase MiaB [Pseudomonadota bacterium]
MNTKYVYINTIGCQMNVYDSDRIAMVLKPLGYKPSSFLKMADLVIVNTCAIREKAEQKVFSFLGRLADMKRKKPDLIIGVGGCVAQQEGARIMDRMAHVDLVFGTSAISRLPGLIEKIESERCQVADIEMTPGIDEFGFVADERRNEKVTRFVTVMQGCDNFCSYCVVPYVRGPETSRPPGNIINEIKFLVENGVREVTLLGQNVNSYGQKEGLCSFPELLALVNDIDGLLRIRFTTSHPKDLSEDLMFAFKDLEKLCGHIHLPVQSGSNRILNLMNRKYTRELYLEKVKMLRNLCPDIAITSDIIVGFPGETVPDFEKTLELIKAVEFDGLFAFKYSDRLKAAAARLPGKISEQEKKERLQKVLDQQDHYTTLKNEALVGSIQDILVEGYSKRHRVIDRHSRQQDVQWTGRTSSNKIVNFIQGDGVMFKDEIVAGKMVRIRIVKAFSHSLWGQPVKAEPIPFGLIGEKSNVA